MTDIYQSDIAKAVHEDAEDSYTAGVLSLRRMRHFDRTCLTAKAYRTSKHWRKSTPPRHVADFLRTIETGNGGFDTILSKVVQIRAAKSLNHRDAINPVVECFFAATCATPLDKKMYRNDPLCYRLVLVSVGQAERHLKRFYFLPQAFLRTHHKQDSLLCPILMPA